MLSAGGKGKGPDYLGTLTNLFKDVASALDEHLELIRTTFGPGGWKVLVVVVVLGPSTLCPRRGALWGGRGSAGRADSWRGQRRF